MSKIVVKSILGPLAIGGTKKILKILKFHELVDSIKSIEDVEESLDILTKIDEVIDTEYKRLPELHWVVDKESLKNGEYSTLIGDYEIIEDLNR